MSDLERDLYDHNNDSPEEAEKVAPNEQGAGEKSREGGMSDDLQESKDERLMDEKEELLALLQRVKADFDNYRKRARVAQEDARFNALYTFIDKLLPVIDNMDRALLLAQKEGVPASYVEGAEMIRKQLWQLLEQEGVTAIEAMGREFDPNYHDAVMQVQEGEAEPNTVVEELQKGYVMKGRVIRPSMVKVSSGK